MSNRIRSNSDDVVKNMTMGERPSANIGDEPELRRAFCTPIVG